MGLLPLFPLPTASLGSSLDAFFDAVETFFSNLAAVHWGALAFALLLHFGHMACRSRGWFNTLRAAYPNEAIQWRRILGSYVVGVGVNSVAAGARRRRDEDLPREAQHPQLHVSGRHLLLLRRVAVRHVDRRAGDAVRAHPGSAAEPPPACLTCGAFDLSFWADHPRFALFTITFIAVGLLTLYAVLSIRAVVFWRRVRQGVVILTDFRRYLRQVAAWQAAAWLLRFFSFFFFLEAFNVGGSVENALLVMSVQALSTLTPFTPGGAGAQQALLVYVFRGKAPRATVLAYSVGQQIAIAAFNVGGRVPSR